MQKPASTQNDPAGVFGRPLDQLITYRLARLNAKLNRQAAAILTREGPLTLAEWRLLSLLMARAPMNGRMFYEQAAIDPGLASRTLAQMETRGLVRCVRDAGDRRNVWASPTDEGRALFQRVSPSMQQRQQRLLAALNPAERNAIFAIIDKLGKVTDDTGGPAS